MPTIFWAGDSTVQYNSEETYPQTGLGQVFSLSLRPDIKISNHAKNGRSTKSFIDESRLAAIYNEISKDDFLFIQFGHNDEKSEDESRYTVPEGTFSENLEKFVNVARNKKAHPVLISPLARRHFDEDGNLNEDAHEPYRRAMELTAKRLSVPFVDFSAISRNELINAGPDESYDWYMNFDAGVYDAYPEGSADNTHLSVKGAQHYAQCLAKGLKELGGIYSDLVTI